MFDFTFDQPWALLLLLAVPVAAWWRWRGPARPATVRHPRARSMAAHIPGWVPPLLRLPDVLRLAALAVFVVALARPQTEDFEVLTGEGVDIMIALDMSSSMVAVDMKREDLQAVIDRGEVPKNRFEIARETLKEFVSNRRQDRIGLVVFGPEAFLKFPPTLDYARVIHLLDGLVLDDGQRDRQSGECLNGCTISGAGTAIGDALARSYQRLRRSAAKSRLIVLITDGDSNSGKLQPRTVADFIASRPEHERAQVYTFLVGDGEEVYVPTPDMFGRMSYRAPPQEMPVKPDLLQYIAEVTGGQFFESYDEAQFRENFDKLQRATFETKTTSQRRDVYLPWALAGALFLLVEAALRQTLLRTFP